MKNIFKRVLCATMILMTITGSLLMTACTQRPSDNKSALTTDFANSTQLLGTLPTPSNTEQTATDAGAYATPSPTIPAHYKPTRETLSAERRNSVLLLFIALGDDYSYDNCVSLMNFFSEVMVDFAGYDSCDAELIRVEVIERHESAMYDTVSFELRFTCTDNSVYFVTSKRSLWICEVYANSREEDNLIFRFDSTW